VPTNIAAGDASALASLNRTGKHYVG